LLPQSLRAIVWGWLGFSCASPPPAAAPVEAGSTVDACDVDRLSDGGRLLRLPDGVDLWHKVSGPESSPPLVFLHGGPGYDAYVFEHSAGERLETAFRMIYVDQRGCGRSGFEGREAQYGMQSTVEDFERLRAALGIERWGLIAHSFGSIVAAEYIRQHPERVVGVVLVDMSPEVGRVLSHHIEVIDGVADAAFAAQAEAVHALARDTSRGAFERLEQLYAMLGRVPIQLRLHYPSEAAQQRMDALDAAAGWSRCTSSSVPAAYAREGYLDDRADTRALGVPALLVSGGASEVIGAENLARAARLWGAAPVVIDGAGHFVYFDRPQQFADVVTRFFERRGPGSAAQQSAPR
jgi:proline iminopeptidase